MASVVVKACKTCGLGARLGLQTSQAELQASLSPADYVYGQPTPQQLQRLLKQQVGVPAPAAAQTAAAAVTAAVFGVAEGLQGASAAGSIKAPHLAASVDDLFNNQLALDLDDDCLRILLGEDEDESGSVPCLSGGSGKGAAALSSEKSSATAEQGEVEAGSQEEDDIAMLFGEMRHTGGSSLDPLELHLLGMASLDSSDDSDTASQACGGSGAATDQSEVLLAAAEAGTGLKRAKSCPTSGAANSPSGRGLLLSMDYEKAAESINLELLASGRMASATPCSESADAMLPLLSPIMDFAAIDTPDSPDSVASGNDAVAPPHPSAAGLMRQDSTSKRKRAVCH